ncbi:hypothetical protein LEMLEM_LOCUS14384 [Lemmus lemmus]
MYSSGVRRKSLNGGNTHSERNSTQRMESSSSEQLRNRRPRDWGHNCQSWELTWAGLQTS